MQPANRNPDQNSGENLIRFEGVLVGPLGFAGTLGQSAKTAQLQHWAKRDGELVESVLPPIVVSNRNPDMAWPAGSFITGFQLNGEYRPVSPCGYNYVMHSRVASEAIPPDASLGIVGTVGSFIPRVFGASSDVTGKLFAPDYSAVADFKAVDNTEYTVEQITIDTLANTALAEIGLSFAAGHLESTVQFTPDPGDPSFGDYTSNILTLLWLDEATWTPTVEGAISYLRASADTTFSIALGVYQPLFGVCCRQGGTIFIAASNRRTGTSWAFPTTQSAPLAKLVSADFNKVTAAGVDGATHPDFTATGGAIEFGFYAGPSATKQMTPSLASDGVITFPGGGYMSIDMTIEAFALCVAPG